MYIFYLLTCLLSVGACVATRGALGATQQSIDISCPPALSSKAAAAARGGRTVGLTDRQNRQTGGRPTVA